MDTAQSTLYHCEKIREVYEHGAEVTRKVSDEATSLKGKLYEIMLWCEYSRIVATELRVGNKVEISYGTG